MNTDLLINISEIFWQCRAIDQSYSQALAQYLVKYVSLQTKREPEETWPSIKELEKIAYT